MTNDEKAKEIGGLCDCCLDMECGERCENRAAYYGAVKMADWKDELVKTTIAKRLRLALGGYTEYWAGYEAALEGLARELYGNNTKQ